MKLITKTRINFLVLTCLFALIANSKLIASEAEDKNFDSVYFHTAVTIAANDVTKALSIADSLFVHSNSSLNKVKSLMLASSLFQQKGDLSSSIRNAEKAYLLAEKNSFYEW